MTKAIRIENADTSDWDVVVEVWNKGQNGEPDIKQRELPLTNPTDMITEYVHDGQYLVVKEV